jgi:hypothetical protein
MNVGGKLGMYSRYIRRIPWRTRIDEVQWKTFTTRTIGWYGKQKTTRTSAGVISPVTIPRKNTTTGRLGDKIKGWCRRGDITTTKCKKIREYWVKSQT